MLSHFFLLFSLNLTPMVPVLRYSVLYGILGILVMANADGVRGVSGRNCSAVCCVPPRDFRMASGEWSRVAVAICEWW